MALAERTADVEWTGTLAEGRGRIEGGGGAIADLALDWASRSERAHRTTSPEELLAAAHASCFAMALSHTLGEAGNPPQRLSVAAAVSFEPSDGGFAVTTSRLKVRGVVPGVDDEAFAEAARGAAEGCPISGALSGNVEISVEAELEQG